MALDLMPVLDLKPAESQAPAGLDLQAVDDSPGDIPQPGEFTIERPGPPMDIRRVTGGGPPVRFAPLSEQAGALGLDVQAGYEHANTPLVNLVEPLSEAEVADINAHGTKGAKIGAGVYSGVGDTVNWFMSPVGLSTLGIVGLPAMAQRVIAAAFAAKMASDVPGIASELGKEFGKPEEERDYQQIARLATAGAGTVAFTTLGASHALKPGVPPAVEIARLIGAEAKGKTKPGQVNRPAVEGGEPIERRTDFLPQREGVPVDPFAAPSEPPAPPATVEPVAAPEALDQVPPAAESPSPPPVEENKLSEDVPPKLPAEVSGEEAPAPVAGEEVLPVESSPPGQEVTYGMGGRVSNQASAPISPAGTRVVKAPPLMPEAARAVLRDVDAVRSMTAPQTGGPVARFAANLLRELNAKMANRLLRADEQLGEFKKDFDRTRVPAEYRYVEGEALPRNYAFIDAYEGGSADGLGSREAAAAGEFRRLNDQWLSRVRALGSGALRTVIENYFPHLWKDPEAARAVMTGILAKSPLEGSKSFLRQRTHRLFRDGLAAGLVPVHDNPVDLFMLKHREVERFILGRSFVNEMRSSNLLKFVHVFNRAPDGWGTVNDRAFTVYGPPTVTIKEAFDAGMREKTLEVLERIGVPHERLARMRGQMWGLAQYMKGQPGTERIKSRFAGPPDVIWHELGHALDNRYPELRTRLFNGSGKQMELRALADLRYEGQAVTPGYKRYVRSAEEKMAVTLQAYLHAPDRMRQVAPAIQTEMRKFIAEHPELSGIEEIRPTLRLGEGETELPHGGLLKLGQWYMPAEAAKVINNYLSPGLQRYGIYGAARQTSNILNAAQLGLSAFHLGFTSLDAAVSRLAVGLEDVARGKVVRGITTIGSTPLAALTNIRLGGKVRSEVFNPGSGTPDIQGVVRALEAAGGRVGQDAFWQTQFTRKMVRAFHEGTASGYIKGAVASPFALLEQTMRPIMEYVVPRQKLGVFADMARREMERLGPGADPAVVREAMRKAWDSVDNRMGQLVYDNLFFNRSVKDLALLSFRAYGWQLGKYRELGGAGWDVGQQVKALAQGKRPELTHRMAYALALPVVVGTMGALTQYLMTGKGPEDWRDYFMPRTGEMDDNGRPVRISLPSYLKDVIAISKHPLKSLGHSLNPGMSVMAALLSNRDYYDTRVFNPDDPLVQKMKDVGLFLGKEFTPFSVQGFLKLREDAPPLWKQVIPFFGVVPTSKSVTMSPAEAMAAEAMADRMPKGSRTREQFDRSKLVKEIVADIKSADPARRERAMGKYRDGLASGSLNAETAATMMQRFKYTPLQFQVTNMDSEGAMRVWRVASPDERQQIAQIVAAKVTGSKTVPPDVKLKWARELQAGAKVPGK